MLELVKNQKHTEYMMLHHQDTGTMEQPDRDQMGTGGELDGSKHEEEVDARGVPSGRGFIMLITFLKMVFNTVSVVLISQLSFNKFICCSILQCISDKMPVKLIQ